jgi:hypothetical protein
MVVGTDCYRELHDGRAEDVDEPVSNQPVLRRENADKVMDRVGNEDGPGSVDGKALRSHIVFTYGQGGGTLVGTEVCVTEVSEEMAAWPDLDDAEVAGIGYIQIPSRVECESGRTIEGGESAGWSYYLPGSRVR